MKNIVILLIVLLCFIASCSHDNVNQSVNVMPATSIAPILQGYYIKNADYNGVSIIDVSNNNNGNVLINYNNSKIVRRIGGIMATASGSGMSGYFSKIIYDTIIYNGNTIENYNKIFPTPNLTGTAPNRKLINLNSNNQIVSKIYYKQDLNLYDNDTLDFEYNGLNKISRISNTTYSNLNFEKLFFYNSNNNISSIITKYYSYNYSGTNIIQEYTYKEIETFGDYDNAPNPFIPFVIFDETFNRSLSINNYRTYNYEKYLYPLSTNQLVNSYTINYNLNYDSDGNAIFTNN